MLIAFAAISSARVSDADTRSPSPPRTNTLCSAIDAPAKITTATSASISVKRCLAARASWLAPPGNARHAREPIDGDRCRGLSGDENNVTAELLPSDAKTTLSGPESSRGAAPSLTRSDAATRTSKPGGRGVALDLSPPLQ